MKAALHNLKEQSGKHRIAILGDMFEVGKQSLDEHQATAQYAVDLKLDLIYLVGDHFNSVNLDHSNIYTFKTFDQFITAFQELTIPKSTILIKGSRGMAMERILEYL